MQDLGEAAKSAYFQIAPIIRLNADALDLDLDRRLEFTAMIVGSILANTGAVHAVMNNRNDRDAQEQAFEAFLFATSEATRVLVKGQLDAMNGALLNSGRS